MKKPKKKKPKAKMTEFQKEKRNFEKRKEKLVFNQKPQLWNYFLKVEPTKGVKYGFLSSVEDVRQG